MKRIIIKLANKRILNNILFNNILIFLGLDNRFAKYINTYNYQNDDNPDNSKTLQEIAGYSQKPEIQTLLADIHKELENCRNGHLMQGGRVLDIGCGPGLFLLDFDSKYEKHGIDITKGMIDLAKKEIPEGQFLVGDFINEKIDGKFDMIFSVGTLMYFAKSEMKKVRDKMDGHLNNGGVLFLSYPHAIRKRDLYFPEIAYNQYSPNYIEKLFGNTYEVILHSRVVDKKKIGAYDKDPFVNSANSNYKTYQNSSILILKKK